MNSNKLYYNSLFVLLLVGFTFFRFVSFASLHAYIYILLFLFFIIHYITLRVKLPYLKVGILFSSFIIFICLIFSLFVGLSKSGFNYLLYIVRFTFPLQWYLISLLVFANNSYTNNTNILKKTITLYKLYLFFEVLFRLANILFFMKNKSVLQGFYAFKYGSFAFTDTNFLALQIQNVMCLTLYLAERRKFDRFWIKNYLILGLFAILTLSRAVILTQLLLLLCLYLYKLLQNKKYVFFLAIVVFILLLVVFGFLIIVEHDGSFRSKLIILKGLSKIKSIDIIHVLFGYGFGEGEYIYSYKKNGYAHLHIAMLLGQYGLIGLIGIIIFFGSYIASTSKYSLFIVFSFVVSGFSLMYFDSSLFLVLAFIKYSERIINQQGVFA